MIPWELVDSAPVPGSDAVLHLYKRGAEFSIRAETRELMNSRVHGSEDALAELACARIANRPRPRLLIGGLGYGYTLGTALRFHGGLSEFRECLILSHCVEPPVSAGYPVCRAKTAISSG